MNMVFSADDRVLIKVLRQEKGYGAKKSSQNFPASQIWGEAARQDANARELQQRKEVSTAQETSRRIADAAAIREERM